MSARLPAVMNRITDIKLKSHLGDRMSVSRRSIICLSLRLLGIIDLLSTDKSDILLKPRPIIVPSTVVCLVILSLSGSEAGGDLALMQAFVVFLC